MQSLIERIRSVFLEMGFSEIEGDYVQSAGWNMDSLFIPQSHPARTMQDTVYLNQPRKVEVNEEYLDLWSRVHEHGHDTGSKGWGGSFDKEESQRALLRTHTTVNTVRHIADNPHTPSRVFGIGRVFRQETIDRTHMPEFLDLALEGGNRFLKIQKMSHDSLSILVAAKYALRRGTASSAAV